MIASDLLLDIYRAYRGKIDSRAPAWGTDKANVAIAIANRKIEEWATDPRNKWSSLFETSAPNEVGTVATTGTTTLTGTDTFFTDYNVGDTITVSGETSRIIATITSDTVLTVTVAFSNTASGLTFTRLTKIDNTVNEYSLNRNFFQSSDYAKIVKTDTSYLEYAIGKPQQRNLLDQSLYIHGSNPKKISFATTIDTGLDLGTLYVPGYYVPSLITASTDLVPVDDPRWLVYIVASELARNDPAKDGEFPTLLGMANDLYTKMSNANNDVGFLQPNNIVNNMPNIGSYVEDWSN
jgi:hypothetical protein